MNFPHWEDLPHGADITICGFARSKAEAFEQAPVALMAVVTNPEEIAAVEMVEIRCTAPDDELLLVEWLNAVIYEMALGKMFFQNSSFALMAAIYLLKPGASRLMLNDTR